MTRETMNSDFDIGQNLLFELERALRLSETGVKLAVDQGVVTLTGMVSSYATKIAVREAAHRVAGVVGVEDEMTVLLPAEDIRSDADLAQAVRRTLEWDALLPASSIQSAVSGGCVRLEGEIDRLADRDDVEHAICRLKGVRDVVNRIAARGEDVEPAGIQRDVADTFLRRAEPEAGSVEVRVGLGRVALDGRVHSLEAKDRIFDVLCHAPGVHAVVDRVRVEPYFYY